MPPGVRKRETYKVRTYGRNHSFRGIVFSPTFVTWAALDPAPTMQAFDPVVLAHMLAVLVGNLIWLAVDRESGDAVV
jgi:hypothetical protein